MPSWPPSPPTDPSPPSPSPSPSPHQGAAARAMAGLTKVAWSPTIPDSCPAGWAAAIASIHPTSLPDGVALSKPRSVRADSIPGSERHDAPLPRVSGAVGACRVDRGQERAITIRPSCGACEISGPRQPGPPTGHSAPPTPRRRSIQQLHSSPITPIIVPSILLHRMGWRYRSRGACGQTVSPVYAA